jgi:quinol monooxygenase YgiN
MIVVTLRVTVPARKRREILQTLRSVAGPTRVAAGCLSCHLYQDAEDENALGLVEEWRTEADLLRHLRSDQYRKVLAVMECAVELPEIKFNSVSHVAGLEAIEAARAR